MATNKFFTWTKGSHDVKRRKPLPLDFDRSPDARSSHSSRTNDSIALQDAAVQSATSLLAVMNDCLSNHLLSTQQFGNTLQPMHGRPRSRTAPSTPMFEMSERISLVELPGSFPPLTPSRKSRTVHQSMDSTSSRAPMSPNRNKMAGGSVDRPHTSPRDSSFIIPLPPPRQSSESMFYSTSALRPPLDPVQRAQTTGPYLQHHMTGETPFSDSDDTLVAVNSDARLATMKHPSLKSLASWQHKSPTPSTLQAQTPLDAIAPLSQNSATPGRKDSCVAGSNKSVPEGNDLTDQIAALRASHEAHVSCMKEAHEREIASHRTYIAILEQQRSTLSSPQPLSKQLLTIDTSHMGGKGVGILSSEASATTSHQSFESTMDNPRRPSSDATAEAEALKRKLSLCRRAQSELGDVRRERDQLRDTGERNDRRIGQLKDIVRKAKDNEKALKNAVGDLEAALLSANNERTDVLEGYYEACGRLKMSADKERRLLKELDELRNHLYFADPAWAQQKLPDRSIPSGSELRPLRTPTLREDPLIQTLDELRRKNTDKDRRIFELEQKLKAVANVELPKQHQSKTLQTRLTAVEAERDRYNSLLHAELRRQNRIAMQKLQALTPQIEEQANTALKQRLSLINGSDLTSAPRAEQTDNAKEVDSLRQELKHCLQEIIMYKLDIKGYKKDLKNVGAQIDALKSQGPKSQKPSTRSRGPSSTSDTQENGLGISGITHQPPTTPQRNLANVTMSALISAMATPEAPVTALSPPYRPVTPLDKHKRLPHPPPSPKVTDSASPGAPLAGRMQRQETLRSLSESIISSYAKRNTPEQSSGTIPCARSRSSNPRRASAQMVIDVGSPAALFASEYAEVLHKIPTSASLEVAPV